MKTLFIDCGMGAAGDMLTAALLELIPDKESFINKLNNLGIPGVTITSEEATKCGINGTHVTVKIDGVEESEDMNEHHHDHEHHHEHSHHHSSMHDIEHIVHGLNVSEKVKLDIINVYGLIAEAESHAHGVPVTEIHFHEVGTMDAIADVASVCILIDYLSPDQIIASPVHVGSGSVKCAHGILPVPAPATAYILKDVPIYGGEINSELCTPTGAALLKYFATSFGNMPVMKISAIGYGMGKKDFIRANLVRVMLGETEDSGDEVLVLSCNLDDMTAEAVGFAEEQLFEAGALEVFTVPAQMKKSRPGTLLTVICNEKNKETMIRLLFKHTSTLGVRESINKRYTLKRSIETVSTEFGEIHKKVSAGYGVTKEKYEYEDLSRIAKENSLSIEDVLKSINK
ncbi:MAG: nickel pincer cofactor biosynthesis protein LarC [Lachnospiraceae bacterium]|nr:nickel pincer cofactor biosynthesis protein LarC [Lachnospiraceae bacterium]